jgi:hypothetical protein
MVGKVRSGLVLEKNILAGKRAVFAGGFAIFWCFVVVKVW